MAQIQDGGWLKISNARSVLEHEFIKNVGTGERGGEGTRGGAFVDMKRAKKSPSYAKLLLFRLLI